MAENVMTCADAEEGNAPRLLPTIAVLLFNDVEVLDFAGPYEVFAAAKDESEGAHTRVFTVAQKLNVTCYGGLKVTADFVLERCPAFDALIVPGGRGARLTFQEQGGLLSFLRATQSESKLIASVCTGSFLVARAGLLEAKRATTHSHHIEQFAKEFPGVRAEKTKIVDEGDVITAAGVSSGIDLALYLLERWCGTDARKREARRLEGPW
jgi:transcriptional regulator GlxA family with amidase domain